MEAISLTHFATNHTGICRIFLVIEVTIAASIGDSSIIFMLIDPPIRVLLFLKISASKLLQNYRDSCDVVLRQKRSYS